MWFLFQGGSIRQIFSFVFRPRVLFGGGALLTGVVVAGLQFEYVSRQFETIGDVYVLLSNLDLRMDLSAFDTSPSNLTRLYIFLFTVRTALTHPWFGVGTGRWHDAIAEMSSSESARYIAGAHSEYQRFTVENGLTGLVLYVSAWIVAFRQALRSYRASSTGMKIDVLTTVGVVVYGALINLFLGGGALNILYLALVTGLLVGVKNDEMIYSD